MIYSRVSVWEETAVEMLDWDEYQDMRLESSRGLNWKNARRVAAWTTQDDARASRWIDHG